MVTRYSFKNKILRAGFYIFSIGGLMMLFAGLLWMLWNHFATDRLENSPLSFLESVGLVSIAYIVYSALRFSSISEECQAQTAQQKFAQPNPESQAASTQLNDLNESQRQQLKREIERCCGKKTMTTPVESSLEARSIGS